MPPGDVGGGDAGGEAGGDAGGEAVPPGEHDGALPPDGRCKMGIGNTIGGIDTRGGFGHGDAGTVPPEVGVVPPLEGGDTGGGDAGCDDVGGLHRGAAPPDGADGNTIGGIVTIGRFHASGGTLACPAPVEGGVLPLEGDVPVLQVGPKTETLKGRGIVTGLLTLAEPKVNVEPPDGGLA